jgi:hypothetical protein
MLGGVDGEEEDDFFDGESVNESVDGEEAEDEAAEAISGTDRGPPRC